MTNQQKAEIMLEALDELITVNWNFKEQYLKAITKGLREIEAAEKNEQRSYT